MMHGGREGKVRFCHSLEVALDKGCGLLVAGGVTQEGNDNARLEALVAQAQAHEPAGIEGVDGDSGYFTSEGVGRLLAAGVDVCIPDSNMAYCLHRGLPVDTSAAAPVELRRASRLVALCGGQRAEAGAHKRDPGRADSLLPGTAGLSGLPTHTGLLWQSRSQGPLQRDCGACR